MMNCLKFIPILFIPLSLFAQEGKKFKIQQVDYNISGKTTEYALSSKVKIDQKKIFQSQEEFEAYISDIQSQIENLRAFKTVQVDYEEILSSDDEISNVALKIATDDSRHFLILPYPKYSSSDGFSVKLKVKDTNFLGSLEDFSADIGYGAKTKYDGSFDKNVFSASTKFTLPFKLGIFDAAWLNDHTISYSPDDDSPAWNLNTGVRLSYPFKNFALVNEFDQRFIRHVEEYVEDYDGRTFFVDKETFFIEYYKISAPFVAATTSNYGDLVLSPFADISFGWSPESSDYENLLQKTELFGGATATLGRVDWKNNLRNGFNTKILAKIGRDFTNKKTVLEFSAELLCYKAFIFEFNDNRSFEFGLSADIFAFSAENTIEYFGERLRGVYDKSYFSTSGFRNRKSTVSDNGIIVNIDMPIKIARIYWDDMPSFSSAGFMKNFNMEIQAGPFIDLALFDNKAADTNMNFADGFLTAGTEILIYPLQWKGIQIRGSFGYDLSRIIPAFNSEWRNDDYSEYEITIGIGLHY